MIIFLFSLKTSSVDAEALTLPFDENVTTSETFEGFEIVSFFER